MNNIELNTTEKQKKFSMIAYQEDLIEKLKNKDSFSGSNVLWIFLLDKKGKVWKVNSREVEFIEDVRFTTFLPPFKECILAMSNIQEKEVLLIDVESFLYGEKSYFRENEIPKGYKCLLLKNKKIGLLANVLPVSKEEEDIEEVDLVKLIDILKE